MAPTTTSEWVCFCGPPRWGFQCFGWYTKTWHNPPRREEDPPRLLREVKLPINIIAPPPPATTTSQPAVKEKEQEKEKEREKEKEHGNGDSGNASENGSWQDAQ